MWPFRKRPSSQSVPSTLVEKPPVREVITRLLRLPGSQWHEEIEQGRSLLFQPTKQHFGTKLNAGTSVEITHQQTSDLAQGELLKHSYELFINGDLAATYFECSYTNGGKMSGGDSSIAELYAQVEREVAENRVNSREWRAAQQS